MKKALITGARGFIGRQTFPFLKERGFEVHAVGRGPKPEFIPVDVQWTTIDLHDISSHAHLFKTSQPTHLLHMAWYAEPGKYWTSLENFHWVQTSLNLFQEFVENGGERIVGAGTCAEYQWDYGFCSENLTPLKPWTPYGVCKKALQEMLDQFASRVGISYGWGRIFFLYGPHEYAARLVSSIILSLLQDQPAKCSPGEQVRDFLHVQDVASAFVTLLDSEYFGPINIGSGDPVPVQRIIKIIANKLERENLIQWGALSAPKNEPPILTADTRNLKEKLGWTPYFGLQEGLEHTIKSYL